MPIQTSRIASRLALELGGKLAGRLTRLQPAGLGAARAEAVAGTALRPVVGSGGLRPTAFDAEFAVAGPSALLDWALALPRRRDTRAHGAALLADMAGKIVQRLEWTDGLLTEVRLPTLDAAASKQAFTVGLAWLPEATALGAPGGSLAAATASKLRTLTVSDFRVRGLPFDAAGMGRVRLPTVRGKVVQHAGDDVRRVRLEAAGAELGTVDLEAGSAAMADAMRTWAHKAGASADGPVLELQIDLLDPTLRKVRATLSLGGCRLTDYAEARIDSGAERPGMPALRFAVESLDLKLAA